jgi:hypothetical protein
VKKFLIILAILAIASFGFSTADAATSALDNVPGGCGVAYWQTNEAGFHTLFNIQNVAGNDDQRDAAVGGGIVGRGAVAVHVTFYDQDSDHKLDFTVPLSPLDNWGAAITSNATHVIVTPQHPQLPFGGYAPPVLHQFAQPGIGADALRYGYVTACITRIDNPNNLGQIYRSNWPNPVLWPAGGNGDDNPWNDAGIQNQRVVLPDFLIMRAAVLNTDSALGFNGNMIQGFLNIPTISEVVADGFTLLIGIIQELFNLEPLALLTLMV